MQSDLFIKKAIRDIAHGDRNAIGVIYDCAYKQIYSVAWSVVKNREDAEDVSQETLCEILRCASSYRGGNAKAWVLAIARNRALDLVKKQSRLTLREDMAAQTELSCAKDALEDEVICMDALQTLGDTEREVVLLRVYCNCRHKEIAQILEISVSASEKHYQRGLARLKAYYQDKEEPYETHPQTNQKHV